MSLSRLERKRELLSRTLKVTNGERPLRTCIVPPGLTLEDAVKDVVENYVHTEVGYLEGFDLAIWRNGKLVAVSRNTHRESTITVFAD